MAVRGPDSQISQGWNRRRRTARWGGGKVDHVPNTCIHLSEEAGWTGKENTKEAGRPSRKKKKEKKRREMDYVGGATPGLEKRESKIDRPKGGEAKQAGEGGTGLGQDGQLGR